MPFSSALSNFRSYLIASALAFSAGGTLVMGITIAGSPAHAQDSIFDPTN